MFDNTPLPRVFGLAPGVDFPQALLAGLRARLGDDAAAMARVQLIVNTRRMQRRLRSLFDQGPPTLLPQIRLISELEGLSPAPPLPPSATPLRRRLELISLVSGLLEQQPHLAPRASLYALTDTLAALMDEMQGEGVSADTITHLDVTDQSGHWQNAQAFIRIAQDFIHQSAEAPDPEARTRQLTQDLIRHWQDAPPQHPVILAGSTGSRGTTMMLMQAVARLPQGAVVLPGFDFDMHAQVWGHLDDAMLSEDHPQYRFHKLMGDLGLARGDIAAWHHTAPPNAARGKVVSLSLRPAPVTHAWRSEGAALGDLPQAMQQVTLVNAPTPRAEALVIAMRLREAAQNNQTAALITPDRMLSRQVSAALDQWDILPDDSAGTPLHLSPPGRFLRHVAGLFVRRLDAEALLTLLKHPLTHSAAGRNDHNLNTQRLELEIRARGLPYPDAAGIVRLMAHSTKDQSAQDWADWVGTLLTGQDQTQDRPLADWVADHIALAQALAAGPTGPSTGALWDKKAGQAAQAVMENLATHAPHGGKMSAADYADLTRALLAGEDIRDRDAPHPNIMIWGTLEARVQGADLVILGGLNEGTWPEAPAPDPWLNRAMRHKAGLLLPERRIGLSAHDYQQAIGAPQVWLTRAIRNDDAASIASRWINRLSNLLGGLPQQGGPEALAQMTQRGDDWLAKLTAFEAVSKTPRAPRPSPRPPVAARPRKLSVTEIKTLIRDPYAIYAKHVLGLRKLGDLVQNPDARLRGNLAHDLLERFVKDTLKDPALLNTAHFMTLAQDVLRENAPWPATRAAWLARLEAIAGWFITTEQERRKTAQPIAFEDTAVGALELPALGFTLTARADRIDRDENGDLLIYDYKTGKPPTPAQQKHFDKQLLLEAAMLERGAFKNIDPAPVQAASYVGVGSETKIVSAPLSPDSTAEILPELADLIGKYLTQDQGFTSRRLMEKEVFSNDYDQLARFGEWNTTQSTPQEERP